MRTRWSNFEWGSGVPPVTISVRPIARIVVALLVYGTLFFEPCRAPAQGDDSTEYQVKLAFLYNFAQFIQWPPEAFSDPAAPLVMCVAGRDPFTGEIRQGLRGRTADGHPIQMKTLKPGDDPRTCHIVFVRASEKRIVGKTLAALKGSSTLTIGESKGFAESGGVINMTLDEDKLRFEINLSAALKSRLKISSKVLALAKIVKSEQAP